MRKLVRPALSERARRVLAKRTESVRTSSDQPARAAALWRCRTNKTFDEIREKLSTTCTGRVRCMYCEDSEATDIEHFYPKSVYPLRAFEWANYLLACSNCNSNYKRTQFPLSVGMLPELINPLDEDPFDHFDLSPSTGRLVPLTDRAQASIGVFGLDRQTLEDGRKDTWVALCALITRYAALTTASEPGSSQAIIEAIKRTSFSCVGRFMHKYFVVGTLPGVAPNDVIESLRGNPELISLIS